MPTSDRISYAQEHGLSPQEFQAVLIASTLAERRPPYRLAINSGVSPTPCSTGLWISDLMYGGYLMELGVLDGKDEIVIEHDHRG